MDIGTIEDLVIEPCDESAPLAPATGILLGSLIGAIFWIAVGLIVWLA